jgi:hypothetical protein
MESNLDELEQTGVLQHVNQLQLEDLLNPVPERQVVEDAEILPRPSRQAALEAVTTLERYLTILEEPYVRKLERLLLSFGRQTPFEETRNMIPTLITDHFQSTD